MIFAQKDFEIEDVLCKPLMAHLSTIDDGAPRDSPVWFLWEDSSLWIFGTSTDSFVKRLQAEPKCAAGIVEYDLKKGILKHVGIRGTAALEELDQERLMRFVSKYLGEAPCVSVVVAFSKNQKRILKCRQDIQKPLK